jgi:hypothetical protein
LISGALAMGPMRVGRASPSAEPGTDAGPAAPQEVGELAMARAAFDQRRDSASTTSRDYLAAQEALQNAREDRLARQGTRQFHEQAIVGSMEDPGGRELDSRGEEDDSDSPGEEDRR